MAKRRIGEVVVRIKYLDNDTYAGTVSARGYVWKFDELKAPAWGFRFASDSPWAYDKMAESAVGFGSYYTSHNRGDYVPDWAPAPEVADAIHELSSMAIMDDSTYRIERRF
jgi:hypothetical protein